jgi:hypothetical protein
MAEETGWLLPVTFEGEHFAAGQNRFWPNEQIQASLIPASRLADLEAEVARWQQLYGDERQARLSLQSLAADDRETATTLRGLLSETCCYVTDALDAYEHTDGRDLLNRITAALNPKD